MTNTSWSGMKDLSPQGHPDENGLVKGKRRRVLWPVIWCIKYTVERPENGRQCDLNSTR